MFLPMLSGPIFGIFAASHLDRAGYKAEVQNFGSSRDVLLRLQPGFPGSVYPLPW